MREKLQGWYAGEVQKKINAGQNTSDIAIEMGIPVMRELTSRWLIDFYKYVKKNPAIIDNGWKKCGITDALANGVPSDDPFAPILEQNCCSLDNFCSLYIVLFA